MQPELVSIAVLIGIFVLATTRTVNLGALGFVAAFVVGTFTFGLPAEDLLTGFPADIFVILVGLTYLFGVAQVNGTLDLLVQWCTKAVRGRIDAMPWIFFAMAAALMSIGAVFSVAIVAPLAMSCARRHHINPFLMGMLVVHGALSTAFSPISVYGSFVNGVVANADIPASPGLLFLMPLLLNAAIAAGIYVALRHRAPAGPLETPESASAETQVHTGTNNPGSTSPGGSAVQVQTTTPPQIDAEVALNRERALTLLGLASLAIGTIALGLDVGFLALTVASLVTFVYPHRTSDAVAKVNWSTVLLICGVVTYVGLLEEVGTVDYASHHIVAIGVPVLAALLLCYLGGITSAFASSIGILAVLIPLAVPFLREGSVSAVGTVTALAFAATVVDVSPFSTNGALILANTDNSTRATMYRQMLLYSAIVVAAAPSFAWLVLVASGWF